MVLGGRGRLDEFVKKRKFLTKIFFQKMLNEVLKCFLKMISADIKSDEKEQEIKALVAVYCIFL